MNAGTLHITTLRFGLQGTSGWNDIVYRDIRATECLIDGLLLYLAGYQPLKLVVVWPEYLYVLFGYLAHAEIRRPAIDSEFRARALAAGKEMPAEVPQESFELGEKHDAG